VLDCLVGRGLRLLAGCSGLVPQRAGFQRWS
jgi:hypothetical protein